MKARLTNLQMREEERVHHIMQMQARLCEIEKNVDEFFQRLRKELDSDINKHKESLKAHLTCPTTRETICRFVSFVGVRIRLCSVIYISVI